MNGTEGTPAAHGEGGRQVHDDGSGEATWSALLLHGLAILDTFAPRPGKRSASGRWRRSLACTGPVTSRLAATLAVAGYLEPAGEPGTVPPVRPAPPRWSPPGATCAGPVSDRTGTVVASISVSGPDSRIDEASIPAIAEVVRHAAGQISARLGGATRPTGMEDS